MLTTCVQVCSVTLTGLGTQSSSNASESIVLIHILFSHLFKEGMLDFWQPANTADHQLIDTSNRYFTSHRYTPHRLKIFPRCKTQICSLEYIHSDGIGVHKICTKIWSVRGISG